nr:MAG TPA: hypothetical protein [Caudoviricetes sp.]
MRRCQLTSLSRIRTHARFKDREDGVSEHTHLMNTTGIAMVFVKCMIGIQ